MTIGRRIARLRTRKGWTQTELAVRAKVKREYVSMIEHGREPSLSALRRLAKALGVPASALLGWK